MAIHVQINRPSEISVKLGAKMVRGGSGDSPVNSVNGKTGNVWLDADDVGALPQGTPLSQLEDDSTHRLVTDEQIQSWNDKYQVPEGGVPESDLSEDVQSSLARADSALQEVPSNYRTAEEQSRIDARKQNSAQTSVVAITVEDWNGGTTCIKNVQGVTTTSIVFVDTSDSTVECTAQGTGTLTFTASQTPAETTTVKIVIFDYIEPAYWIDTSLTHCIGDNPTMEIEVGSSYENVITADTGYTLDTSSGAIVSVIMGGTDITSTAWDSTNHKVSIASVTGDISISIAAAEIVSYVAVTRNLIGCASTETTPPTQTIKGQQYQESFISESTDYDLDEAVVHVYVGGVEISNVWTYNNNVGTVTIPADKVTGDITISIQAAEAGTWSVDIEGISEHLTMSNNSRTVQKNASYSNIVGTTTGWQIQQSGVHITMGGTDITSSAWQIPGNIYIGAVMGDLVITVPATAIPQGIDATLTNCSGDNDSTSVNYNDPYVNNLTADSGYTFNGVTPTILMDDEPVAGAWTVGADGTTATINIAHVTGSVEIVVEAVEIPQEEANISFNLTHCEADDKTTTTLIGEAYNNRIIADTHYHLDFLSAYTIEMWNGTSWVDQGVTFDGGDLVIEIPTVTGDIRITVEANADYYLISGTLTHCKDQNQQTSISTGATYGSSYENVITTDSGYTFTGATVIITMGGTDITLMAWDSANHKVSIASVTGDISISITAAEIQPEPTEYVQFTAKTANSQVSLKAANGASYKYCIDGSTWNVYTSETIVELASVGDFVRFRGNDNTGVTYSQSNHSQFTMSGKIEASGNVNYLLSPTGDDTLVENCFMELFKGCTSLTTAPELPATTLADSCYDAMFSGCTSLTTAPELPATSLTQMCYYYMFSSCTSLTTAPELPATSLNSGCYAAMFSGCSSLTTAPELPATNLDSQCYFAMFSGCDSLTTAPELPATNLDSQCYFAMFDGCSALNSVSISAITWNPDNATNWLRNTAATGTLTCPTACSIPSDSTSGIPTGWTRVNV